MTTRQTIQAITLPVGKRLMFLPEHFGELHLAVEFAVYNHTQALAKEYTGGLWQYRELSNGGAYMRPDTERRWQIQCATNGYQGEMSSDALGITATLFALSHLSFRYQGHPDGNKLAEHFHWLRDFALDHEEATEIFAAID